MYVSEQENVNLTPNAASLIARIADGGMRDALSLLDQCVAYDDNITVDTVSTAAGIAGRDYLFEMLEKLTEHYTDEQKRHIVDIYVACSRYELAFWDLSWDMKS